MYSDYYEREYSPVEIQQAFQLYQSWCKRNKLKPEVEGEIETVDQLDHVLYHAEEEKRKAFSDMSMALWNASLEAEKYMPNPQLLIDLRIAWLSFKDFPMYLSFDNFTKEDPGKEEEPKRKVRINYTRTLERSDTIEVFSVEEAERIAEQRQARYKNDDFDLFKEEYEIEEIEEE